MHVILPPINEQRYQTHLSPQELVTFHSLLQQCNKKIIEATVGNGKEEQHATAMQLYQDINQVVILLNALRHQGCLGGVDGAADILGTSRVTFLAHCKRLGFHGTATLRSETLNDIIQKSAPLMNALSALDISLPQQAIEYPQPKSKDKVRFSNFHVLRGNTYFYVIPTYDGVDGNPIKQRVNSLAEVATLAEKLDTYLIEAPQLPPTALLERFINGLLQGQQSQAIA